MNNTKGNRRDLISRRKAVVVGESGEVPVRATRSVNMTHEAGVEKGGGSQV